MAWEGKVWLLFKAGRPDFFLISKELFFWWCGMGCLEKAGKYDFLFLFLL